MDGGLAEGASASDRAKCALIFELGKVLPGLYDRSSLGRREGKDSKAGCQGL